MQQKTATPSSGAEYSSNPRLLIYADFGQEVSPLDGWGTKENPPREDTTPREYLRVRRLKVGAPWPAEENKKEESRKEKDKNGRGIPGLIPISRKSELRGMHNQDPHTPSEKLEKTW